MKLPIEATNIRLEASLNREQINALITWYFEYFLNKSVVGINYPIELPRITIQCRDKVSPTPETPTKEVKQAPLVDIE